MHRVGVVLHRLVYVYLCLGITLLLIQDPGVGVEIGRVVGFGLYRAVAHLLCLGEVEVLLAQIVGIVVEARYVVALPLQTTVVGGERLLLLTLGVEDVAHESVEVGHKLGVALLRYLADTTAEGIEGSVALILLVVGQAEKIVERHLVGDILYGL